MRPDFSLNNGGFLPDIMLLTLRYHHREIRLNAMKKFCFGSLCSHLYILTISPSVWGMLRRFRCVQIFFKQSRFGNIPPYPSACYSLEK